MTATATLREFVKAEMARLSVSVDEVAKASGVDRSMLYRFLKGQVANPSIATVEAILGALGADFGTVFGTRRASGSVLRAWAEVGRYLKE